MPTPKILLAVCLLSLTGCVNVLADVVYPPHAPIHFLDEQTALSLRGSMPVYMQGAASADIPTGENLGEIEARSCKEDRSDKGASLTEAVDLLRQQGAQAGASAVVDVTCSPVDERTYVKGCSLSYARRISCRGVMIKPAGVAPGNGELP